MALVSSEHVTASVCAESYLDRYSRLYLDYLQRSANGERCFAPAFSYSSGSEHFKCGYYVDNVGGTDDPLTGNRCAKGRVEYFGSYDKRGEIRIYNGEARVGTVNEGKCSANCLSRISINELGRNLSSDDRESSSFNDDSVDMGKTQSRSDEVVSSDGSVDKSKLISQSNNAVLPDAGLKSVGKNVERNRQWRREKKERKQRKKKNGYSSGSSVGQFGYFRAKLNEGEEDARVSSSLKKKWELENELAAARAERQLAILKASDLDDEVKRYRTKVKKHTESNMVAIEKTHATLVATGNVPGVVGFAETVVTDKSISPDSSASMQEFRACQKKNLDLEAENKKMKDFLEKNGMSVALVEAADKQTFTDNTENGDLLDQLYPEGQGFHIVSRNGKNKLKIGCDVGEVSASFEPPAVEDDEYARRWVTQYSFIDAYARFGSSDEDLCAEAEIGISVLRKYRRLKKQLNM